MSIPRDYDGVRPVLKRLLVCSGFIPLLVFSNASAQTAEQQIKGLKAPYTVSPNPPVPDRLACVTDPSSRSTDICIRDNTVPVDAYALTFKLMGVDIEGNTSISSAELEFLWQESLNQEISVSQLWEIGNRIQAEYRRQGYPFTRVVVGEQTISREGGRAKLRVVEGFIYSVSVEAARECATPVRSNNLIDLASDYANQLVNGEIATLQNLERAVLLINDIYGVRATAIPQRPSDPSAPVGAVSLSIRLCLAKPVSGVLQADNRRSPVLGPGLAGAVTSINSYSGRGDTTEIAFFNSFDLDGYIDDYREQHVAQIRHRRFLGDTGTQLSLKGIYAKNRPGGILSPLNFSGEQFLFEAEVMHPFKRTRELSVWTSLGIQISELTSDVSNGLVKISDDSIRTVYYSIKSLQRSLRSNDYTLTSVSVRHSLSEFGGSQQGDRNLSRFDADDFIALQAELEMFRSLRGGINFKFDAQGQVANKPLLASEEFAIGGLSFGRAYDPAEVTGDNGFGASIEFSRPVSLADLRERFQFLERFDGINVTFEPFIYSDYGRVKNIGQGQPQEKDLSSAGGGLRIDFPINITAEVEVAAPMSDSLNRTNDKNPRFFVQLQKRF